MDALKARLATLNSEIRKAQRRRRSACATEKKKRSPPLFDEKVAAQLTLLCDNDTDAALGYLEQKGCRQSDGQPWSREDVLKWSRKAAGEPSAAEAHHDDDVCRARQLQTAHQFLLEKKLYLWVREQNESKGLTPTITRTVAKYESLLGSVPPDTRPQKLPKTSAGRWKWGKRWATRWQVAGGLLKADVRLPAEQRQAKARRSESGAVSTTCPRGTTCSFGWCPDSGRRKVA